MAISRPQYSLFQSTPSAWRVTTLGFFPSSLRRISIHTLRVEGDFLDSSGLFICSGFQSTPSAWRVTSLRSAAQKRRRISIHTLRVEGDCRSFSSGVLSPISIHTLRVEGDTTPSTAALTTSKFQSTPSAWRVTARVDIVCECCDISIHTLRVEGDLSLRPRSVD